MRNEDLDSLAERYPDCIIAAYADITTGITLLTNTGPVFPQEALDELCAEAALTLGVGDIPPVGALPCQEAIKSDESAVFVYLRAPDDPGDALVCMCRPGIALDPFLADARACVGRTAGGQGA